MSSVCSEVPQTQGRQFGKSALVGVAGTAAHYAVLYMLVEFWRVGAVTASGFGALMGVVINYILNHGLTFISGQPCWRAFPKSALTAGIGLVLNLWLMALLVNRLAVFYLLAQVMATGAVLAWNFLGGRLWTIQADNESLPPAGRGLGALGAGFLKLGLPFIALIAAIRLLTLGAYPLVDPTESRYAEMARKMVETGNWVTPQIDYGVPFWGKPPLAVWLNAIDINLFGVNEFAVRFSALLLSLGIGWLVYRLASLRGSKDGFAPAILSGMVLFFVMAGSVAMDQALAFGTTLTMASFWLAMRADKPVYGFAFFIGLAIGLLSKGPIALVLAGFPIGLWTLMRWEWAEVWRRLPWIRGTLLMLAISVPWYIIAEQRTPGFLEYFIIGEHWKRFTESGWQGDLYGSGRAHPRGTIWVYWLVAAFPWSLVFLAAMAVALWRRQAAALVASSDGWRWYCLLWMLSPLLFFTLSANVIWTYVLPGLPGCALLLSEWRREGRLGFMSGGGIASALGMIVPLAFLGMVIAWQFIPLNFVRTQKVLVEQYYQLRSGKEDHLYYLWDNPFSAQFYTHGQSRELSNVEVFQTALEKPGRDFYVCPKRNVADLPDAVKNSLQYLGRHEGLMLFRRLPDAETR